MSPLFKVGDLVVRNPEARGESGWPYDDAVCRVVGHYPNLNEIIVVPVNSPPNKRYQGTGWLADRFTPAYMFTGIEPPKEVMRITRDGIRVAVGVSVDEAAQAVLNALSVEIRRLVDVARADDTALLRQVLEDICGAKLCEVNSMSSRAEARRLLDKATNTLRERLEETDTGIFQHQTEKDT